MAVFHENSVRIEDNSGESPALSDEERESSSESEVDRREYGREQRQDRSPQLRSRTRPLAEHVVEDVRARGRRGGNRAARIQDGGQQYVWLEKNTRRKTVLIQELNYPSQGVDPHQLIRIISLSGSTVHYFVS